MAGQRLGLGASWQRAYSIWSVWPHLVARIEVSWHILSFCVGRDLGRNWGFCGTCCACGRIFEGENYLSTCRYEGSCGSGCHC